MSCRNCGDGKCTCDRAEAVAVEFDFGQAIKYLKQGRKVARKGWNGKGKYIFLQEGSVVDRELIRNENAKLFGYSKITINSHIDMKTANDSITIGWAPSQVDMLAEDYVLVG